MRALPFRVALNKRICRNRLQVYGGSWPRSDIHSSPERGRDHKVYFIPLKQPRCVERQHSETKFILQRSEKLQDTMLHEITDKRVVHDFLALFCIMYDCCGSAVLHGHKCPWGQSRGIPSLDSLSEIHGAQNNLTTWSSIGSRDGV
jgi:hypothetical protein